MQNKNNPSDDVGAGGAPPSREGVPSSSASSGESVPSWQAFDVELGELGGQRIETHRAPASSWGERHRRRLAQTAAIPGLLPVIGAQRTNGMAQVVQYAPATPSLADRSSGPTKLPWHEATGVISASARALHAAHLDGLVHGALSAEDVRIYGDEIAIAGAGVAHGGKMPESRSTVLAPEVAAGELPTARSDVFSLGKLLETAIAEEADVPAEVKTLARRATAQNAGDRPVSARFFAEGLERAAGRRQKKFGLADLGATAGFQKASSAYRPAPSGRATAAGEDTTPTDRTSSRGLGTAAGAGVVAAGAAGVAASKLGGTPEVDPKDIDLTQSAAGSVPTADADSSTSASASSSTAGSDSAAKTDSDMAEKKGKAVAGTAAAGAVGAAAVGAGSGRVANTSASAKPSVVVKSNGDDNKEDRRRKGWLWAGAAVLGLGAVTWIAAATNNDDSSDTEAIVATTEAIDADSSSDEDESVTEPDETTTTGEVTTTEAEAVTTTEAEATTTTAEATTTTEAPTTTTAPPPAEPEESALLSNEPLNGDQAAESFEIIHAIPGFDADMYLDGELLAAGLSTGGVLSPIPLETSGRVELFAADVGAPLRSADRSDEAVLVSDLEVGSAGSVVAHLDADGNPQVSRFASTLETIPAGQGRLSLKHVAAIGPVSIDIDGNEVAAGIVSADGFESVVAAGSHLVVVTTSDGQVIFDDTVDVPEGELTSAFVGGTADDLAVTVRRVTGLGSAPASVPSGNAGLASTEFPLVPVTTLAVALSVAGVAMRRRFDPSAV